MLWGMTGLTQLGEVNRTHDEDGKDSGARFCRGDVNEGPPL